MEQNGNGGEQSLEISIDIDEQEIQINMENGNDGQQSLEISMEDEQGNQRSMENGNDGQQPLEISMNKHEQCAHLYLPSRRRRLYIATKNGNWSDAEEDLKKNPAVYITEGEETPLHISALADKLEFVKELVKLLDTQGLEKVNKAGNTALSVAASTGNVEIAKVMIVRHPNLLRISGVGGTLPVTMAAKFGHGPMVEYLRLQLEHVWTDEEDAKLLTECIASDCFDVARKLIELKPALALSVTAWDMLTRKPMADKSKTGKWKTFLDSWALTKEADDENSLKFQSYELLKVMLDTASKNDLGISSMAEKAPKYLFDAAKQGNLELFKLLLDKFPDLVWAPNERKLSLFHVAVEHRHESIFALMCEMDEVKRLVTIFIDANTGDNMLHLAAKLAPKDKLNIVTGAAFQMQQAILWYKAVEKMVPSSCRNMPNNKGKTPSDIFDKEHKCLLKEGENWTKGTAKSCMLVAALIATVIFAAAFTVPGGNNNEGYPCLLNRVFFQLFSISEVIGLFSSSTSILMFLSILTARVDKYAFQHSLPCKLMIGLTTLFLSIASMVVAFCSTIFLSYRHASTGIPVLLLLYVCVPLMFILLKYRLLVDIVHSTFVSRFMFGSRN